MCLTIMNTFNYKTMANSVFNTYTHCKQVNLRNQLQLMKCKPTCFQRDLEPPKKIAKQLSEDLYNIIYIK